MTLKKSIGLAVVAAALAGAAIFAWRQNDAARPETRYKLHVVDKGDLNQTVSANGTLNPVTLVNVGTQVSGAVRKLYVDFNDKVEKGQILLELDDALLSAQVRQSQAGIASAQASLELAAANEARMKSLLAQDYVSRQEYDQTLQAKKAAEAQLALVRAQHDRDRANLAYSVIRSPVSGVVVDRVVDLGQTVAASFQTPTLIKIAQDLSQMQIDSSFAEADIGNIRVGQNVRFNVDAFPNRAFRGSVKQIRLNPTTQQNVVTYNVVVAVENPEQILLPGMTAYVSIVVNQRKDALRVPNAALRFKPADAAGTPAANAGKAPGAGNAPAAAGERRGEGSDGQAARGPDKRGDGRGKKRDSGSGTVYVLTGGELKAVSVALGITDNRTTEIVGGELKPGDQVVVGETQSAPETTGGANPVRMRMF